VTVNRSTKILQIWRNTFTKENVSTVNNNGDWMTVGDVNVTGTGFFDYLGSVITRITKGWFTDLDVENSVSIGGDLNVTGTIHNSLSHMYGLATAIHTVASGGVWYNITMNTSVSEYTSDTLSFHTDNQTLELGHDGHYTITFGMGILDSDVGTPDAIVGMRIGLNGEEMLGSYIEEDTHKKNADKWVEHTTHFEGSAGDNLTLQYISDSTTVTIAQTDTYATQGFSAFGYLQEVII